MTEFDLNSDLTAAVAKWQKYGEPCPPDIPGLPRPNPTVHRQDCLCGGTNYVQPAIVKALIEAVSKPAGVFHNNAMSPPTITFVPDSSGRRMPRDWEEIGEGALEGVLRHWYWNGTWSGKLPDITLFDAITPGGDSAALAAVDEALERMFGGRP